MVLNHVMIKLEQNESSDTVHVLCWSLFVGNGDSEIVQRVGESEWLRAVNC